MVILLLEVLMFVKVMIMINLTFTISRTTIERR